MQHNKIYMEDVTVYQYVLLWGILLYSYALLASDASHAKCYQTCLKPYIH